MSRKLIVIAAAVIVLAGAAAAAWHFLGASNAEAAKVAVDPGYAITDYDRTMGNPKAPIVLIEYAAPVCPHCAKFNEEVVPLLKRDYIDTGKVFYVFRVFPLRPEDGAAEKLARCLPRNRYFSFMDQIFKSQPTWDPMYGVEDVRGGLLAQAKIAGMSEAQFDACVTDTKLDATINKVGEDAQKKYMVSGTPTIVLNGQPQQGVATWDALKLVIDAALLSK